MRASVGRRSAARVAASTGLAAALVAARIAAQPTTPPDGTALPAPANTSLGWTELLREQEDVRFEAGDSRHELRHHFLQFGSEVVEAGDSVLVRNRDYGIDYARGVLFLLQPAREPHEFRVHYLHVPGPRERQYRAAHIVSREEALAAARATAAAPPGTGAGVAPEGSDPRALSLPPGLQLVGSKTIGVSFGRNREASLEQSLRVQVAGNLGDALTVNAVLSDDNLPVVPEGNTEELGDLNRVFIEVQGPVIGGVVGDFDLTRHEGEFVRFERELRGGEARLRVGAQEMRVAAGLARGELLTATFRGTEGKQGPYELLSARRLQSSTILPGSERVYLDGRLLRRGDKQDYVIDYTRAELRFTSSQRITADSEIAVDYLASTQTFSRQTTTSLLALQKDSWRLQGFFMREGDDRDNPVGDDLTDEDIAALAAAGDQVAIGPGIQEVGAGNGLYRRDAVDSTVVVYDPLNGDLDVQFYETGAGRGAYEDQLDPLTGRRFFEFRGAGLGAFEIGRLLPPPARNQLVTASFSGAPWTGARLVGEASVSDFDANLFSPQGDTDNQGEAIDVSFDSGEQRVGRGHLGAAVHLSQLSSRFVSPGRGRSGFYYKEWNAEQDTLQGTERLGETTLRYALGGQRPWARVAGNLGRLDRGDDLMTDRLQMDAGLGSSERGIDARWQSLDTQRRTLGRERTRRFGRGGARYRLGPFLPQVRLERDEFVRSEIDSFVRPSYRYLDTRYTLGIGRGALRTSLEFGRRDTEARTSDEAQAAGAAAWRDDRRNDTWGVTVVGRLAASVNTELAWSRRSNEPRGQGSQAATRSDLARAFVGWRPQRRALRTELRYEISDEDVRKLEQVLVRSADGRGDYDAEGRPVGKDQGEYDKVFRFLGDVESVKQLETSWRLELGGRTLGGARRDSSVSWWRRNLSLVQVLSVQEQTRDDSRALYLLQPRAFQGDGTVFGSFRARQEWGLLNGVRDRSLRVLLSWEDDLDARSGGEPIDSRRGSLTLRYERTGHLAWTWGADAELGLRDRQGPLDAVVPGRPSSDTFDVRQQAAEGRLGYRLSPSQRVGMDLRLARQRDRLSDVLQHLVSLAPSAILVPVRDLRLFVNVTATRVFEQRPVGAVPPFLFEAPGTRANAALTGSYRIGRNLNLNLTYSAVRSTDGRFTYDVKAETRAIF